MDTLWMLIFSAIQYIQAGIYAATSPLHVFGPAATIAAIAVATAMAARTLTRRFKTKRYRELKREFEYWFAIKQEVTRLEDADFETARQMGKTIDSGQLNKAYYDFFFEGLLNNLLTLYMPVFSLLVYVNYTYRPEVLERLFGQAYLFELAWVNGQQYQIGAVFWFVACVFVTYLTAVIVSGVVSHRKNGRKKSEETACFQQTPS
ncbi:MAG: hypothetical protein ACQERN_02085 [Thermodesulfobacteriota bacterium]